MVFIAIEHQRIDAAAEQARDMVEGGAGQQCFGATQERQVDHASLEQERAASLGSGIRGGSVCHPYEYLQAIVRSNARPSREYPDTGFRLARRLPAAAGSPP